MLVKAATNYFRAPGNDRVQWPQSRLNLPSVFVTGAASIEKAPTMLDLSLIDLCRFARDLTSYPAYLSASKPGNTPDLAVSDYSSKLTLGTGTFAGDDVLSYPVLGVALTIRIPEGVVVPELVITAGGPGLNVNRAADLDAQPIVVEATINPTTGGAGSTMIGVHLLPSVELNTQRHYTPWAVTGNIGGAWLDNGVTVTVSPVLASTVQLTYSLITRGSREAVALLAYLQGHETFIENGAAAGTQSLRAMRAANMMKDSIHTQYDSSFNDALLERAITAANAARGGAD